jgi:hypothetical protein
MVLYLGCQTKLADPLLAPPRKGSIVGAVSNLWVATNRAGRGRSGRRSIFGEERR